MFYFISKIGKLVILLSIKDSDNCILNDALKIISKKWTAFVFCQLLNNDSMNFNELLGQLADGCGKKVTPSVLSQTLKELEEYDLLKKKILTDYIPMRTEYKLTNKGKELRVIYGIIKQWALKWFDKENYLTTKLNCYVLDVLPDIKLKTEVVLDLSTALDID